MKKQWHRLLAFVLAMTLVISSAMYSSDSRFHAEEENTESADGGQDTDVKLNVKPEPNEEFVDEFNVKSEPNEEFVDEFNVKSELMKDAETEESKAEESIETPKPDAEKPVETPKPEEPAETPEPEEPIETPKPEISPEEVKEFCTVTINDPGAEGIDVSDSGTHEVIKGENFSFEITVLEDDILVKVTDITDQQDIKGTEVSENTYSYVIEDIQKDKEIEISVEDKEIVEDSKKPVVSAKSISKAAFFGMLRTNASVTVPVKLQFGDEMLDNEYSLSVGNISENVSEIEIPEGYGEYEFVNARVDGAVIEYVAKDPNTGDIYYSTGEDSLTGTIVEDDDNIVLYYSKPSEMYNITYKVSVRNINEGKSVFDVKDADQGFLTVTGADAVIEGNSLEFSVNLKNDRCTLYRVVANSNELIPEDGKYKIDKVTEDTTVYIEIDKIFKKYQIHINGANTAFIYNGKIQQGYGQGDNQNFYDNYEAGITKLEFALTGSDQYAGRIKELNKLIINGKTIRWPQKYSGESQTTEVNGMSITVTSLTKDWEGGSNWPGFPGWPHDSYMVVIECREGLYTDIKVETNWMNTEWKEISVDELEGLGTSVMVVWNNGGGSKEIKLNEPSSWVRCSDQPDVKTYYILLKVEDGYDKESVNGTLEVDRNPSSVKIQDISSLPFGGYSGYDKYVVFNTDQVSGSDIRYYFRAEKNAIKSYSVKYDYAGGMLDGKAEAVDSKIYNPGEGFVINPPVGAGMIPIPKKDGFDFVGWSVNNSQSYNPGQLYTISEKDVDSQIVFTAVWKQSGDVKRAWYTVKVYYEDDNGSEIALSEFRFQGIVGKKAFVVTKQLRSKLPSDFDVSKYGIDESQKYSVVVTEDDAAEIKIVYKRAYQVTVVHRYVAVNDDGSDNVLTEMPGGKSYSAIAGTDIREYPNTLGNRWTLGKVEVTPSDVGSLKGENDNTYFEGTMPSNDVTITFVYNPPVTVFFDPNGGNLASSTNSRTVWRYRTIAESGKNLIADPQREGFEFKGWTTERDGGEEFTVNTPIDRYMTVYASWEEKDPVKVHFDANGGEWKDGEAPEDITLDYNQNLEDAGKSLSSIAIPESEDYYFVGWRTAAEGGEQFTDKDRVTEDITLYASWNKKTVLIVEIPEGEKVYNGEMQEYIWKGEMIPSNLQDIRINYKVTEIELTARRKDVGCVEDVKIKESTDPGEEGIFVKPGYKVMHKGQDYADQIKVVFKSKFTITWDETKEVNVHFDANGGEWKDGETPEDIILFSGQNLEDVGKSLSSITIPESEDYYFVGWRTAAEGGEQFTDKDRVTEDITLYASWNKKTVLIVEIPEGERVYNGEMQEYTWSGGSYPANMQEIQKEYYVSGIELTARLKDVGSVEDVEIKESTDSGEEGIFVKPGYRVMYKSVNITDSVKVIFKSKFTITWDETKEVNVHFDANGGEWKDGEAPKDITLFSGQNLEDVGKSLSSITIPESEDYYFVGWRTAAEGGEQFTDKDRVTEDITLYASWNKKTVLIVEIPEEERVYNGEVQEYTWSGGSYPANMQEIQKEYYVSGIELTARLKDVGSVEDVEIKESTDSGEEGIFVKPDYRVMYKSVNITDSVKVIFKSKFTITWDETKEVNVHFDANGGEWKDGEAPEDIILYYGQSLTNAGKSLNSVASPKRPGYNFANWLTESGETFAEDAAVLEDITLYASWTERDTVTVTFVDNYLDYYNEISTVTLLSGQSFNDNDEAVFPDTLTKRGWKQVGWVLEDGTTRFTESDPVESDITVYTNWVKNDPVTISFYMNDGSTDPYKQTKITKGLNLYEDQGVSALAGAERDGYIFCGWNTNKDAQPDDVAGWFNERTTVEDNIDVYAIWKEKIYLTVDLGTRETVYNGQLQMIKNIDLSQEQIDAGALYVSYPANSSDGEKYWIHNILLTARGKDAGTYTDIWTDPADSEKNGIYVHPTTYWVTRASDNKTVTDQVIIESYTGKFIIEPGKDLTVIPQGDEYIYDQAGHGLTSVTTNIVNDTTLNFQWRYSEDGLTWENWIDGNKDFVDAGYYEVKVTAVNPNYETASETATVVIKPRPVKITVNSIRKTYDAPDGPVTGIVTSLDWTEEDSRYIQMLTDLNISYGRKEGYEDLNDAGDEIWLTANYTLSDNYDVTVDEAKLTIDKKIDGNNNHMAVISDGAKYDGTAKYYPAATNIVNYKPGTTFLYSTDGVNYESDVPGFIEVGEYPLWVKGVHKNYADCILPTTMTITPCAITLDVEGDTAEYDGNPHGLTKVDVNTENGCALPSDYKIYYSEDEEEQKEWNETAPTFTDAGTYTIYVKVESADKNYTCPEVESAVVTINKKLDGNMNHMAVISAGAKYDGTAKYYPAATNIVNYKPGTTFLYSTDGVNYESDVPGFIEVGTYPLWVKGVHKNYADCAIPTTMTITPCAITLAVEGYTGTYDGEAHSLTKVDIKTENGCELPADYKVYYSKDEGEEKEWGETALSFTDAGTYTVYVKVESTSNNYTYPEMKSAVITINKSSDLSLTIQGAVDAEGTAYIYDGEKHGLLSVTPSVTAGTTLTYRWIYRLNDEAAWEEWSEPEELDINNMPFVNAGTYNVIVFAENPNYISKANAKFVEIKPRPVTIAVNNKTKVYGQSDAEAGLDFDGTVTAFGWNDAEVTSHNVSGVLNIQYGRTEGYETEENVGEVPLTATYDKANTNYDVEVTGGILNITPSDGNEVAVTTFTTVYDGTLQPYPQDNVSVTQQGSTILYSTDNGRNWTEEAPAFKNAGEYTFKVKATNPNYMDAEEKEVTMIIGQRPLTIIAASATRTYNGRPLTAPAASILSGNLADGDRVERVVVSGSITNVGTEENVPSNILIRNADGEDVTVNYAVSYVNGQLRVLWVETPGGDPDPTPEGPAPTGVPGGEPTPTPGAGEPEPTPGTPNVPGGTPGGTQPVPGGEPGDGVDDGIVDNGAAMNDNDAADDTVIILPNADSDLDLTAVTEPEVPLANNMIDGHVYCILHFLLMLAALIMAIIYTDDMKKRQKRIHELKSEYPGSQQY